MAGKPQQHRPPLRYHGGKHKLAQWIIERFPTHTTYVEPFAGGFAVGLHKTPARFEVYNDLDSEVVNFFRVLRDQHELTNEHHEELAHTLHNVQGHVLLSGYPSELYDAWYEGWRRDTIQVRESYGAKTECLWLSPRTAEACPQQQLLEEAG